MSTNITVEIKGDSRYPVDKAAIRQRISDVLLRHRVSGPVLVSVAIVGDRKMRALNKHYRQKDYSTDVLSFPTYDPTQPMEDGGFEHADEIGLALGDIIVAYPQAVKIAAQKNRFLDEIVCDLIEHGLLHLLGIHHD